MVVDFIETDLSRFIEQRIMKLIIDMQKAEAESLNTTLNRIEVPKGLSVRVLVNSVLCFCCFQGRKSSGT